MVHPCFTPDWTRNHSRVVAGNFAPSFSLKFLSIFVLVLGFTEAITLIRVSLERSFPPAGLKCDDANFGQK